MTERMLLVVGDKFHGFTLDKDAVTLSQLKGILALPPRMLAADEKLTLVPGQGLGDDDVTAVAAIAKTCACRDAVDLHLWSLPSKRAAAAHSHKHHPHNTLISEPRRVDEGVFEMDLLVDERCELMADHQTGQHLQGMLLVEAARQSFLAVSEAFFIPRDGERYYFVFDDLAARYKRFVFPVGATLIYMIRDKDGVAGRQRFSVEVSVQQGGAETAVISGVFTVVKEARINRMEGGMAREALAAHLAEIAAAHEADMAEAA